MPDCLNPPKGAQFERDSFQGRRCLAQDRFADYRRAGEGNLRYIRIARDFRAHDVAAPIDDIDHAGGNIRRIEAFHCQLRLHSTELAGFGDDRTTRRKRRRYF
jgi:hypothetical protein